MSFPKSLIIGILASYEMVNNTVERIIPNSPITVPFMQLLAQALGFSCLFVAENGGEIGDPLPDGNWTGLVGYAQRGEVDMIGHRITLLGKATMEECNVVRFLYPYDITRITFMTRKPEYVSDAAAILRPFSYNVWIAITICLTVMPLMFYLMDWKKRDLQRHVMYTFEIILQRSSEQHSAKGLLIALWLIPMTVLGYCYLSQLLSFLTLPTLTGVRTINELAAGVAKGNYACKTNIGKGMVDLLLQSDNPAFQAVGRDIEQEYDPKIDLYQFLKNTKSLKKPAIILMSTDADSFKKHYFLSEDTFFTALFAIATRRDFCCTEKLDQAILYISAAGLYNKIVEDINFMTSFAMLSEFSGEEDAERKLTMTDLKTVFIFLVVGNSLAFIVLLIEIVFAKYSKKSERKRRNTFLKVVKINVAG